MPFKTPEKKKKRSGMRKYMYLIPLVAAGGVLLADSMSARRAPQTEVVEVAPISRPTPSPAVPKGVKIAGKLGGLALGAGLIGYASGTRTMKALKGTIKQLETEKEDLVSALSHFVPNTGPDAPEGSP
jgi:hypothetical protein